MNIWDFSKKFLNKCKVFLPCTWIDHATEINWTDPSQTLQKKKKIAENEILPSSFYEATITLIPKPDKDITQKKKITGQYHQWA